MSVATIMHIGWRAVIYLQDDSDGGSDGDDWDDEEADTITVHAATGGDRAAVSGDDAPTAMDFNGSFFVHMQEDCSDELDTPFDTRAPSEANLADLAINSKMKYQQQLAWKLKHVPYGSQVAAEADVYFTRVKQGLVDAILMRDLRCAFTHWCSELQK